MENTRKAFESFILNNRIDDPRNGSINRSRFSDGYEYPRLSVGWACWKAALSFKDEQKKEKQ